MKFVFTNLLLFFVYSFGMAQSASVFKGRVLSENNKAVAFAHVFLVDNHELGVITNEIGEFNIEISDTAKVKKFIISHILFITDTVSISSDSIITIYLSAKPNILDEVTINSTRDSVYKIIGKVFKSMKKNYPTKPYFCEAFYRETDFVNQENVKLTEAVINIQDFGYKKPDKIRVLVKEFRQSEDYGERNSAMVYLLEILGKMFNQSNEIHYTIDHDVLRHIEDDSYFFSRERFLSSDLGVFRILCQFS